MPDTVLLPDGTLFVNNGGTTGIAGGTSGAGEATDNGIDQAGIPDYPKFAVSELTSAI